ncbi:MAG TPA: DoxX family protein [Cyclobacteriaceae bacterium]|nr:DoxX family protein [Cyclobacteriaceae bacterium]
MQRIIDLASRVIVGGLFIFSGLIKLNDPVGTKIKLEEYFEVFAADFGSFFHFFIPYALFIGTVLIVLEVVIGVAVLINYRMQITTWVLLILLVFFTFLTGYSAILNKVTDCGCFGDAIKLTPWQSFYKDLFLLVFVMHLFWHRKRFDPMLRTTEGHGVIAVTTAVSVFLGVYAIRHLPFIDFLPYKIGNSIPQQMIAQEQPVFEYVFLKDGKEIKSKSFLSADEGYQYQRVDVLNPDKIIPKITDYQVSSPEGEDLTQESFTGAKLLIIMGNVQKTSTGNMKAISKLINDLDSKLDVWILTSSNPATIDAFRHEHQLAAPYHFADATVLKSIVRSDPGLTLWYNGIVLNKWHHNDTPDAQEVLNLLK